MGGKGSHIRCPKKRKVKGLELLRGEIQRTKLAFQTWLITTYEKKGGLEEKK